MEGFVRIADSIFDPLERLWEHKGTHQWASGMLVVIFLVSLGAIELNRQGMLPDYLAGKIPVSHYLAINIAFTLVLIIEVISLIFTIPSSLSRALGKQFEILALIFLRSSFKELASLPEPASVVGHMDVLWKILGDGAGAITIFALLGLYTKQLQLLDHTLKPGGIALVRFVAAKKLVAATILVIFLGMGIVNGWLLISGQEVFHFFHHFYTVLIFSDVLLVLIAQCFLPEFRAVFRNAGYALATLLIRLALTAPSFYNVLIGAFSVVFAVLLTAIYNTFYTSHAKGKQKRPETDAACK